MQYLFHRFSPSCSLGFNQVGQLSDRVTIFTERSEVGENIVRELGGVRCEIERKLAEHCESSEKCTGNMTKIPRPRGQIKENS